MIHWFRRAVMGWTVCILLLAPLLVAQERGPLRAGVAKVDITPTKEMLPIHQNFRHWLGCMILFMRVRWCWIAGHRRWR